MKYWLILLFSLYTIKYSFADESLELIGFRGNELVYVVPNMKDVLLHQFEHPMTIHGVTSIDDSRMIFSSGGNLYLFSLLKKDKILLGHGYNPAYDPSNKTLYYFSSKLENHRWVFYLTSAKLVDSKIIKITRLKKNKVNEAGGEIHILKNQNLIYQAGGENIYHWNDKSSLLSTLPIRDCILMFIRTVTNGLICGSWKNRKYREISLFDFNEVILDNVKGNLFTYNPRSDTGIGLVTHFSILKGEYYNLTTYNFNKSDSVEYKDVPAILHIVWSN